MFLFAGSTTYTQSYLPYYTLTSQAKYKLYAGKIDKAIALFEEANTKVQVPYGIDLFYLSKCYAINKNSKKVYKYINQAIRYNYIPPTKVFDEEPFYSCLSERQKKNILNKIRKKINYLSTEKEWVRLGDSIYYYVYNDGYYYGGNNRISANKYGSKYIDSSLVTYENFQEKLCRFINTSGFPGLRKTGKDIFILPVIHLSLKQLLSIEPKMLEEFNAGNITPNEYGAYLSRLERVVNKDFCTYFIEHPSCHGTDLSRIIKNRESIGMSIFLDGDDYSLWGVMQERNLLITKVSQ